MNLERKITFFHAKIIKKINLDNYNDALVGFHGQTIYHNAKEKISKQLGDGKLLNQLTKKRCAVNPLALTDTSRLQRQKEKHDCFLFFS